LFAVSEVDDFDDSSGGAVVGLAIDPESGKLTKYTAASSEGAGPCHLTIDGAGGHVLVANYGGGSVAALPLDCVEKCELKKASSFVQHEGSGAHPQRQTRPHAHSIDLDPANKFAFVCDLGVDKVFVYRFDKDKGQLTPHDPPYAATAAGAGPRHLAFHPSGRWAYVINELNNTVTAYRYDAKAGQLEEAQTVSTLPDDFSGDNTTAEVQVHPSGKFLYGSNRGHDSIAMFAIDEQSGRLTPLGQHPSGGSTPRNFGVDPTGKFLLAAHQNSNSVVVHRINLATGRLEQTDHQVEIPAPVCVKFFMR
jgi:6-phosphogluconolactonase